MSKEEMLEAIKGMSVLELSELVKALEEEFGVSAAAPMALAAASAAGGDGAAAASEEEEEQTDFTVVLQEFGANKINVIKAVREVTTLGLREAKDLVESAPANIKEGVTKEEAGSVKDKLVAAGATAAVQ